MEENISKNLEMPWDYGKHFDDEESKPIPEDYEDTPTSDLFAIVCKECSKETILDMAEQYIPKYAIREFLFACLGLDIE